jgi:hypothetical protein
MVFCRPTLAAVETAQGAKEMDASRFLMAGVAIFIGLTASAAVPARAEDPFCFECHDDFPA